MKQSEKGAKSKSNIVEVSVSAFAEKGYNGVTLNGICHDNGISKGQFYHYFISKDDLFQECVERCFADYTKYLKENVSLGADYLQSISHYIDARTQFFKDKSDYGHFILAVQLTDSKKAQDLALGGIKKLYEFNHHFFGEVLNRIRLRTDITKEKAIAYLEMAQQTYHAHLRTLFLDASQEEEPDLCQQQIKELLEIILKGISES